MNRAMRTIIEAQRFNKRYLSLADISLIYFFLLIKKFSSKTASSPEFFKVRKESWGEQQIGSPCKLKEVFRSPPMLVRSANRVTSA